MAALFSELLIILLMIFALVTLVSRYASHKNRIKALEQELAWYRRAAMHGKIDPYPDEMEKRR